MNNSTDLSYKYEPMLYSEYSLDQTSQEQKPSKRTRFSHSSEIEAKQFLPTEVLEIVFTFVGCEKDIFKLQKVNHHFNRTLKNYSPFKLLEGIKQLRQTPDARIDLFYLPSIERSTRLQKQFSTTLSEVDKNYKGCQRLIELFSIYSLSGSSAYSHLVSTNPFLFESLVKANGLMLEFVGESLQRDLTILQSAVQQNKNALQFVPKDLQDKIKATVNHEIHNLFMQEVKESGSYTIQRVIEQHSWVSQHLEKPRDVFRELDDLVEESQ